MLTGQFVDVDVGNTRRQNASDCLK